DAHTFRSREGRFDPELETPICSWKRHSARPARHVCCSPKRPTPARTLRRSISPPQASANSPHSSGHRVHNSKAAPQDPSHAKQESASPPIVSRYALADRSQFSQRLESQTHSIPAVSDPGRPLRGRLHAARPRATPAQTAAVPIRTSKSKQSSRFSQYSVTAADIRTPAQHTPRHSVIIDCSFFPERKTR